MARLNVPLSDGYKARNRQARDLASLVEMRSRPALPALAVVAIAIGFGALAFGLLIVG